MKITMFHFMPYRDLPEDFPGKLPSAWVDAPWWEYGDANKVTDYYNWSIDELMLAAKLGINEAARADLSRLLELVPQAADAGSIRQRLEELRGKQSVLN